MIPEFFLETETYKPDRLPDNVEEPGEKQRPGDGIEDGVWGRIVAPVLVTPEVVLDERKAERFSKSSPQVPAFVNLRRKIWNLRWYVTKNAQGEGRSRYIRAAVIKAPRAKASACFQ